MKRNISKLTSGSYDLLIVGGGIFGACAAWDAALRGLKVALIEKGDFSQATSSQHFKLVHGGIRYLQHGDWVRLHESVKERRAFFRIAPHMIDSLPIVIPAYGNGMKGKGVLGIGMFLYDLLTFYRNKGITSPEKKIPRCRLLSRDELLKKFPDVDQAGLTGGALFHDGQMYNPPRLVLSFLKSADEVGACVANYVEAVSFIKDKNQVVGVQAKDLVTNDVFNIKAKLILNATGPWADWLLKEGINLNLNPKPTFSRDAFFLIKRKVSDREGLAVLAQTKDPDSILSRNARHLFIIPWREYALIGVWHVVYKGKPDSIVVQKEEIETFIDEFNAGYPSLKLTIDDVTMCNAGLILFGENKEGAENLSYGKRSMIIDHNKKDGLRGLLSLIGIRATTARGEAVKVIDMVYQQLGLSVPQSKTDRTPLHGGDIENVSEFFTEVTKKFPIQVGKSVINAVLKNYGSRYTEVLDYAKEDSDLRMPFNNTNVLKCEILHAIDQEMAVRLVDVLFRRTELCSGGNPGDQVIEEASKIMASEMKWDEAKRNDELQLVQKKFPKFNQGINSFQIEN